METIRLEDRDLTLGMVVVVVVVVVIRNRSIDQYKLNEASFPR